MKRRFHIIVILLSTAFFASHAQNSFDPYQFQREASAQVVEKVESELMAKIEAAIAAGEKEITKAIYLQEVLEPLKSYGIDPEKEGYYKDIQAFYSDYTSNPDFDPRADVQTAFQTMVKTKLTNEVQNMIGQDNLEMGGELRTLFDNASKKTTAILEALESVSHIEDVKERQSEFKKAANRIGLTGKFFDAIGDLENILGETADRLADPMAIISAIVSASSESNPSNKIKMLFEFGESYGGRIPIVGDIVQALFTVGRKLIEAAELAGGLIESNIDQYCIYAAGSHNFVDNNKKESFVKQHPGISVCPLREKGVYTNIYVNQSNYTQIYFYIDGVWVDGNVSQYHKGGDDIFLLVQWLRSNGYVAQAQDLKFLSRAYNKIYGFRYFKDLLISKKLENISQKGSQLYSQLKFCGEDYLELFFMDILGFEDLNTIMTEIGGFDYKLMSVLRSMNNEITDEIVRKRYLQNEVGLIGALNKINNNLSQNQVFNIYGSVTDEKGNPLENVKIESRSSDVLFNGSNCDRSSSRSDGSYSFFVLRNGVGEGVQSFSARYEGVSENGEILINKSKTYYELNFTYRIGNEDENEKIDNDGDGFSLDEDCNDEDFNINPRAQEIPDNNVDENCDGVLEYSEVKDSIQSRSLKIIPSEITILTDEELVFQVLFIDESGVEKDVSEEALFENPFKSKRTGSYKVKANYNDLEVIAMVEVEKDDRKCKSDNEEWNEDLSICQCKEGFSRNEDWVCVETSSSSEDKEDVEEDTGNDSCEDVNEIWNSESLECECIDGYQRDDSGNCVSIAVDNECNCPKGEVCNDAGICVPFDEAIGIAEEGLEEDCLVFEDINALLQPLLSEQRSIESQISNYIRKFEKEINDRAAIPCENKLLSFTYYSINALLDRLIEVENQLQDIYLGAITFYDLSGLCGDFSSQMSIAGYDNSFVVNEMQKFEVLNDRIKNLDAQLIENGCDPEVVIQEGQTVQPPGSDPDFIDNGGTSAEIDGDGKDNDGDGLQDEIPTQGLPGYNLTIVVYDSGNGKDDIFGISIDGQGFLGNSPKGGLRSYGLNLPTGTYSGYLEVILAADDIGTYTINIFNNQENIYFDTGEPPEGTRIPFTFEIAE